MFDHSSNDWKIDSLSYTPFDKKLVAKISTFHEYYYITFQKITVDNKKVKIPYKFMVLNSNGNGGTIVDSSFTYTFMEKPIFVWLLRNLRSKWLNIRRIYIFFGTNTSSIGKLWKE